MSGPLLFLKLGGSLLGDKRRRNSFRAKTVQRLGREIAAFLKASPATRLLLAHGGGGLAHFPARQHRTREGLAGGGGWAGFAETRRGVLEMNARVLDALASGGLRPILVSPSAGVIAKGGRVSSWDTSVIQTLLHAGQAPMIHGDCVLDRQWGFTILSTEELFEWLAGVLKPRRVVLACDVRGVYLSDKMDGAVIPRIDGSNLADVRRALARPDSRGAADVTGGMVLKVEKLVRLARTHRSLHAQVVSGRIPGAVPAALAGEQVGTVVCG